MEIMRRESLKEFTEFRRLLRAQARAALENTHPRYVQRFAEELKRTEDFEQAASAAQPLLGKGIPKWSQLLTLTLDLELALDKTRRALSLLGKSVPALGPEWNSGAWTVYQLDHWTFEIDAWMERLDRLVKRVCRQMLRPQCPEWKELRIALQAISR